LPWFAVDRLQNNDRGPGTIPDGEFAALNDCKPPQTRFQRFSPCLSPDCP
jgi:hypothetical protein